MATIGTGWIDGAWVQAGWQTGAWSNVASVAVTGTITSATEADIVAGGQVLTLTLIGDTWVTTDGSKTAIIAGLDGDDEATGWDAVVQAGLGVGDVAFSVGDTVCTITLPAFATFDITADSTVTATIPAASLTTSAVEIIGTPTFTISAVIVSTSTGGGRGARRLKGKYPRRISIDGKLIWVNSAAEERHLLTEYAAKLEREALMLALDDKPAKVVAKARVKVVRAARRLADVDTREADWLQAIIDEDDELIALVLH